MEAFRARRFFERRRNCAALLIIAPKLRLEFEDNRRVVPLAAGDRLNFADPEMSLLRVTSQIVEHPLLRAIKAHGGNVPPAIAKTTAIRAGATEDCIPPGFVANLFV